MICYYFDETAWLLLNSFIAENANICSAISAKSDEWNGKLIISVGRNITKMYWNMYAALEGTKSVWKAFKEHVFAPNKHVFAIKLLVVFIVGRHKVYSQLH